MNPHTHAVRGHSHASPKSHNTLKANTVIVHLLLHMQSYLLWPRCECTVAGFQKSCIFPIPTGTDLRVFWLYISATRDDNNVWKETHTSCTSTIHGNQKCPLSAGLPFRENTDTGIAQPGCNKPKVAATRSTVRTWGVTCVHVGERSQDWRIPALHCMRTKVLCHYSLNFLVDFGNHHSRSCFD